jgi:hypothetical protein
MPSQARDNPAASASASLTLDLGVGNRLPGAAELR